MNFSPTLFNTFINDLITACDVTKNCDAPLLDNLKITCLLYADDLVLLSKSKKGLQNLLHTLDKYAKEWFMGVNMAKTKCVVFGKRKDIVTQFHIGSVPLETCDSYTYLGDFLVKWLFKKGHAISSR